MSTILLLLSLVLLLAVTLNGAAVMHGVQADASSSAHPQACGTLATPCLSSSPMTLPNEGGFSPSGSGSHGLDKTSPMAASMLSFDGCACSWSCDSCWFLLASADGVEGGV